LKLQSFNPSAEANKDFAGSPEWESGRSKNITFVLTEECQLRCKYCYFVAKNSHNKMSFDIARRTIDYLLGEPDLFPESSVVIDFIGGEPLLEIDLLDKICDYFKMQSYLKMHPWFERYRISISTNGLLYSNDSVQRFISKNKTHLGIGITIDGIRQKHDLQRVFPDGRGSYEAVVRQIPLWLEQFPESSTKVTIAREDLPYIKDSILHLWDLGIKYININLIFENVWKDGDDLIFEDQLVQLADEIIKNRYYIGRSCSFFSRIIGKPVISDGNWCGAGKMLAVDSTGSFYPCVRFTPFSLNNREAIVVGNCFTGIDSNRLRPFLALNLHSQSPAECLECNVASGCAWCQGMNYDVANIDTIYQRATYLCKMHKARVRANQYFYDKIDKEQ